MDQELRTIVQKLTESVIAQNKTIERLAAHEALHHMIILRLVGLGAMAGLPREVADSLKSTIETARNMASRSDQPSSVEGLIGMLKQSLDLPEVWQTS